MKFFVYVFILTAFSSLVYAKLKNDPNIYKDPKTGEFKNVNLSKQPSFLKVFKWSMQRIFVSNPTKNVKSFPLQEVDLNLLKTNKTKDTYTWIGHVTSLIQTNGFNVLFDPHFSKRASPVGFAGPKRLVPPAIKLEDLPQINFVLITHNHYDHLDKKTIEKLKILQKDIIYFVPLGNKKWFIKRGISPKKVFEFSWWDEKTINNKLSFIFVPSRHWSKRSLWDTNKTLWGSWVIRTKDKNILFIGDTGYSNIHKEIGRRFGPFDLAAIPIGAYIPRWLMKDHHINPKEAVKVHKDIKSKLSVSIHWGTFVLSDEPFEEPPIKLIESIKAEKIDSNDFLNLRHGETIFF